MLRDHQWHPPPMLTTLMMHQPDHRQGGISGAAPQNAYIMTRRSHSGGRPNKNADLPVAAVGLAEIWVRFQIVGGGLKTRCWHHHPDRQFLFQAEFYVFLHPAEAENSKKENAADPKKEFLVDVKFYL